MGPKIRAARRVVTMEQKIYWYVARPWINSSDSAPVAIDRVQRLPIRALTLEPAEVVRGAPAANEKRVLRRTRQCGESSGLLSRSRCRFLKHRTPTLHHPTCQRAPKSGSAATPN